MVADLGTGVYTRQVSGKATSVAARRLDGMADHTLVVGRCHRKKPRYDRSRCGLGFVGPVDAIEHLTNLREPTRPHGVPGISIQDAASFAAGTRVVAFDTEIFGSLPVPVVGAQDYSGTAKRRRQPRPCPRRDCTLMLDNSPEGHACMTAEECNYACSRNTHIRGHAWRKFCEAAAGNI